MMARYQISKLHQTSGGILDEVEHAMLSEKFFLLLETLRSEAERSPTYSDERTTPHPVGHGATSR